MEKREIPENNTVMYVNINCIRRFKQQPRKYFNQTRLNELVGSIEVEGQLDPIWVRPLSFEEDEYHLFELIDGERRLNAAEIAGDSRILVLVRHIQDEEEQFKLATIRNFGREGHTHLEIADATYRLIKMKELEELSAKEKMARVAKMLTKSESFIFQHLRLLKLDTRVRALMNPDLPEKEQLGFSHAILLTVLPENLQYLVAQQIVQMTLGKAKRYVKGIMESNNVSEEKTYRPAKPSDKLKKVKTFIGRTHEGAEEILGMKQSYLEQILTGSTKNFRMSTLDRIGEAIQALEILRDAIERVEKLSSNSLEKVS